MSSPMEIENDVYIPISWLKKQNTELWDREPNQEIKRNTGKEEHYTETCHF